MAGVGAEFSLEPEFWKKQRTGPLHSSRDLQGTTALLCRGSALSAMRTVQGPALGGERPPTQPAGVCGAGRLSLSPRRAMRPASVISTSFPAEEVLSTRRCEPQRRRCAPPDLTSL